jgi:hypothetical protein
MSAEALSTPLVDLPRFEAPRLLRLVAYAMALTGAITVAIGLHTQPARTWTNILLDDFYLVSLCLAGVLFVAIQHLARASWCAGIRRIPEAMATALPVVAVLLLALFFGRHWLYPWSHPGHMQEDATLAVKAGYLSTPFVFVRMAVVLAFWGLLARRIRRTSRQQDTDPSPDLQRRLVRDSALFVVLFAFSFFVASVDWLMSLDPHWFSTIFAVYAFAGLFVAGIAAITLLAVVLRATGRLDRVVNENHLHDLGKLLFAFTTFWAYIWLSQYLLIWYGNLPEEIRHYVSRTNDRWIFLFLLNLVVNWVIPFVVLLPRAPKRNPRVLAAVCVLVLAGRWLDLYLLIAPEIAPGPAIGGLEILIAAGYAGLFLSMVMRALAQAPLVALNDPHLAESLHHRQ